MKNYHPLNLLNLFKDKIKYEFKLGIFTKFIPVGIFSFALYNIYKYRLYRFGDCCFESLEEKQISKKLYPLLKYKYIQNYYDEDHEDVKLLKRIYETLIKIFKLNLKAEIYLTKTDLQFFYLLPTGTIYLSDVL